MLAEKKIRYTKKFPGEVVKKHYLDELIFSIDETDHLNSFKTFYDFIKDKV